MEKTKDTNPKDAVGTKKVPFTTVSHPVMAEVGLAMMEGARKYGRHNYRVAGVRTSVYIDAAFRHLGEYWEGQSIDRDSGMSNLSKAIACLMVLRDSEIHDMVTDDRPPKSPDDWLANCNRIAEELIKKYPVSKEAYTQVQLQKPETYKLTDEDFSDFDVVNSLNGR